VALSLDPEVGAALKKMLAAAADVTRPPVGDWKTRRRNGEAMHAGWARIQPLPADVVTRDFAARSQTSEA